MAGRLRVPGGYRRREAINAAMVRALRAVNQEMDRVRGEVLASRTEVSGLWADVVELKRVAKEAVKPNG